MLLLGMGIITTSCNKIANNSLTGIWLATDYVLTAPGSNQTLSKNEESERTFQDWNDATLKFDDAGNNTVWFYGINLLHYKKEGNKIIITDGEQSVYLTGQTLTLTGGKIKTEPFIIGMHNEWEMSLLFEKQ